MSYNLFKRCSDLKITSLCVPPLSVGKDESLIKSIAEALHMGFYKYLDENKGVTSLKNVAIVIYDSDISKKPTAT